MAEVPLAVADRIIRKGSGLRVGADAAEFLAEILEERGIEIASSAGKFAKHAGRKTVKAEDIKLVIK